MDKGCAMKRRAFFTGLAAAGLVLPHGAVAQDAQTRVIQRLQRDGYRNIRVSRTFLGRIRIVARGVPGEREIILNPSTGAILRDVLRQSGSDARSRDNDHQSNSDASGPDYDDDDDDDGVSDDNDEDDDYDVGGDDDFDAGDDDDDDDDD